MYCIYKWVFHSCVLKLISSDFALFRWNKHYTESSWQQKHTWHPITYTYGFVLPFMFRVIVRVDACHTFTHNHWPLHWQRQALYNPWCIYNPLLSTPTKYNIMRTVCIIRGMYYTAINDTLELRRFMHLLIDCDIRHYISGMWVVIPAMYYLYQYFYQIYK